jgi:hypothetical protein
MALSDQLTKLAAQTREFEDNASKAQSKSEADLRASVAKAHAFAQAQGDMLRKRANASKADISSWWEDVQRSWNDHLSAVRKDVEHRHAVHDVHSAKKQADRADDDAAFAIDYASAALIEAEYAVLDAALAHKHLDELAGSE